jgi:hypothetical protein
MRAVDIGLRGLAHPFGMLSLVVLLANDHILKPLAPSYLTGKLSDLAGLFFFPFLLAAAIGWLPGLRGLPTRLLGILCFAVTLAWFSAVKTLPVANAATTTAIEFLTGQTSLIALDPSDLLALFMLLPGWKMWVHFEKMASGKFPQHAYACLIVAALATMATSCLPYESVQRLVVDRDDIYAGGRGYYSRDYYSYYVSKDGGKAWKEINERRVPKEVVELLHRQQKASRMVCNPNKPELCYRSEVLEQIDISTDGGKTWQVGWQIPEGRRMFISRVTSLAPLGCRSIFDIGPYDLIFFETDQESVFIAAMGTAGWLLHPPGGDWKFIPFDNNPQVSYQAEGIHNINVTGGEIIALGIFSTTAHVFLGKWWYLRRPSCAKTTAGKRKLLVFWLIGIMLFALAALISAQDGIIDLFFVLLGLILVFSPFILISLLIVLAIPIVLGLFKWAIFRSKDFARSLDSAKGLVIGLAAEGMLIFGYLPFYLWATGAIAEYWKALFLSSLALAVIIGLSLFLLDRLAQT